MQLCLRQLKIAAQSIVCNKVTLVILLLIFLHVSRVTAERTCHQCRGINCLRTSYEATEKCLNDLDICVTVFDGQTVQAQGCLEKVSEDLRIKCNGTDVDDSEELSECFKCNTDLCNNFASSVFECIQCDSNNDVNCRSNPTGLKPSRCLVSRTPNEYCFVKQEGSRVIRGCTLTLEEQKTCQSLEDCMICQPSNLRGCNNIEVKVNDEGSGSDGSGGGGAESGSGEGSEGGSGSSSGGGGSESGTDNPGNGGSGESGTGDGGSGSGSGGSSSGGGGSTGTGGSGSSSGSGSTETGGSGSSSGGGSTETEGSGSSSGGGSTETGGSGSSSGGGSTENGGSGSSSGGGSSESGGDGSGSGNGSGTGDESNGNNSNVLSSHIFIFVVNIILIFLLSK